MKEKNKGANEIYLAKPEIKKKKGIPSSLVLVCFVLIAIAISFILIRPFITGYATSKGTFIDVLNFEADKSQDYSWTPENFGKITSVRISGELIGDGNAKVYLKTETENLLIYDSGRGKSAASVITGFALAPTESEQSKADKEVKEKESEKQAPTENPAETPVEPAPSYPEPAETPPPETPPAEEQPPTEEQPLIIIPIPIEQPPEETTVEPEPTEPEPAEENVTEEIPPAEEKIKKFKEICEDTCLLDGLNETKYTLVIEVDDGTKINIQEIIYTLKKEEVPTNLTEENLTEILPVMNITNMTLVENITIANITEIQIENVQEDAEIQAVIDSADFNNETNVLSVIFHHDSSDIQPIKLMSDYPLDYTLSVNESSANENVTLVINGWSPSKYFEIKIGQHSQIIGIGDIPEYDVNAEVKDAGGNAQNVTVEFEKPVSKEKGELKDGKLKKGRYDVKIIPSEGNVKEILINEVNVNETVENLINLDFNVSVDGFMNSYAIDPTVMPEFTSANITVTAKGNELYKCKNWNFSQQNCIDGNWIKLMDINPGQEYTFTLTPEDPGYGENATGLPSATLAFFMDSDSAAVDDKRSSSATFGESPIQLNDYGETSEKCGIWECPTWTGGSSDKATYCSGGWNCSRWNGVTCAEYKCLTWTVSGTIETEKYCSGGWNCASWQGDYCRTWNCAAWTDSSNRDDKRCSGLWTCESWTNGICARWNCDTWADSLLTKADTYCSGLWNCTSWSGAVCQSWNCTAYSYNTANYDEYCSGNWHCDSWNGKYCAGWGCTAFSQSATAYYDQYCTKWNCSNWDTGKKVCIDWTCLNQVKGASANFGYQCTSGFNCTYWEAFNGTAPVVSLVAPANGYTELNKLNVNFTYNVSDESNIQECDLYIQYPYDYADIYENQTAITKNANQTFSVNFRYNGNYKWNISCTDSLNTVGWSASRNITIDVAGIQQASGVNYTLHNESDAKYTSYKKMLNASADSALSTSESAVLSTNLVTCWNASWLAPNSSIATQINGTWDFNIYTNCSATFKTNEYYVMAKILKRNSTAEYNLINTSWIGFACAAGAPTLKKFSNSSIGANLSTGEQIGAQLCVKVTNKGAANKYGWMFWETGAPSSINIPYTVYTVPDYPPKWSNNQTSIVATYSPSTLSLFNGTWQDEYGVSRVFFESNYSGSAVNYTMNNITGNSTYAVYNYSVILPAGTFYWRSNANDTSNQKNSTDVWYFTVNKLASSVNLTLNGTKANIIIQLNTAVNLSCSIITPTSGAIQLYKNGTLINSGNSPISNATNFTSAGNFNVTCLYPSTQNYSASSETYYVNVVDTIKPILTVYSPTSRIYNNRTIFVNFTATDNVAVDKMWFNNGTANISYSSEMYANSNEGNNTFTFYANDTSGNVNSTSVNFSVDTIAPYVTNILPSGNNYSQNQQVNVSVNATDYYYDSVDSVKARITYPNASYADYVLAEIGNSRIFNNLLFNDTIKAGRYNITITANDSAGNTNNTEKSFFTVNDVTFPKWSSNKTNAVSGVTKTGATNIRFNITLTDDTAGGYYIFSFDDGTGAFVNDLDVQWNSGDNISVQKNITTTREHTVRWQFSFNDSAGNLNQTDIWQFTVANTAPETTIPDIKPDNPNTTADLYCDYTYSDADGDPESITTFKWFKNNVFQNLTTRTISNTYTNDGEEWMCEVTPYDGYNYGNSENSTTETIGSSAPSIVPPYYTDSNSTNPKNVGQSITFTVDWSDPDQPAEMARLYVCNTSSISSTGCAAGKKNFCSTANSASDPLTCSYTALQSDNTTNTYYVKVCDDSNNCSGGISSGTFEVNHAPTMDSANITSIVYTNDILTCSGTSSDLDLDSMTIEYAWFNNSALVPGENSSTFDCSALTCNKHDNITCQQTVKDEHDLYGSSMNISVLISNSVPVLTADIPNQAWYTIENKTNAINLSSYFSDADNDVLNFTSIGTVNISVTINATNNMVSFSQTSGFIGTENVTFIANDSESTTNSNNVTLSVTAVPVGGHKREEVPSTPVCTSDWQCSGWSACINGTQIRPCLDLNNCGTLEGKPAESQSCGVIPMPPEEYPAEITPEGYAITEGEGVSAEIPKAIEVSALQETRVRLKIKNTLNEPLENVDVKVNVPQSDYTPTLMHPYPTLGWSPAIATILGGIGIKSEADYSGLSTWKILPVHYDKIDAGQEIELPLEFTAPLFKDKNQIVTVEIIKNGNVILTQQVPVEILSSQFFAAVDAKSATIKDVYIGYDNSNGPERKVTIEFSIMQGSKTLVFDYLGPYTIKANDRLFIAQEYELSKKLASQSGLKLSLKMTEKGNTLAETEAAL